MPNCFFVSDLHGREDRYLSLFDSVARERPAALFLGGDLLPHIHSSLAATGAVRGSFVKEFIAHRLSRLREELGEEYPRVFAILGNDDPRIEEQQVEEVAAEGLWEYVHCRKASFGDFQVYGYSCVPPTPFLLKDWERFDVSRYVDPGCIPPEDGLRSVEVPEDEKKYSTIADDLERLAGDDAVWNAVLLLHAPPYNTVLDRAALDGKAFEHAPLDVHIGSIAVRRFIEQRQPLLSLHGHVHESARITGLWRDRIGRTHCFTAAHDGPQLALVRFDPAKPEEASRELLSR